MGVRRRLRALRKTAVSRYVPKKAVLVPVLEGRLLTGRRALVTGGTSGIGLAIAEAYVRNGADVVVCGRLQQKVDEAVASLNGIGAPCHAWGIVMDVCNRSSIENGVRASASLLGSLPDILVNSAGINGGGRFGRIETDSYDRVMDTNLRGTLLVSQEVARLMVSKRVAGNILNLASSSSLRPANTPYIISKWGIRGLTLGMAKTLIHHGIVVNGLAPGPTATPMLLSDPEGDINKPESPSGRYAVPEEIANMAVVLASSIGRMVVGDIVYMTGGSGLVTIDEAGSYDFEL